MARQKTLLTAAEFFRLYSHKDGRYELVDGEVVEMAPTNEQHGAVALNIGAGFNLYSRQGGIGRASVETGYRLRISPDTVRGPDVSFVVAGKEAWESLGDGFGPASTRYRGRGGLTLQHRRGNRTQSGRIPSRRIATGLGRLYVGAAMCSSTALKVQPSPIPGTRS